MTYPELHDRLIAAGVDVGIAVDRDRLVITLASGRRSIRYPVSHDVDAAAREIVLSGRLRQLLGPCDAMGRDRHVCGSWPEFVELWPMS